MNQGLNSVTGQDPIRALLLSSVSSGRISHAYIFEGDTGMGKKTLAYAFARQLICEHKTACGDCRHCKLALSGNHPDIITLSPSEDKQSISVDNIRSLYETVMVKPFSADKKVIIIPGAEKMGHQAQNALLKMLEEPPSYIVFILLATSCSYFLDTVLSRCIKLSFQPYTNDMMRTLLTLKGVSDVSDAVISCSGGNIGKALELISGGRFMSLRKELSSLFDLFFENKSAVFEMVSYIEANKDSAEDIFDIFISFARELIMCHLCTQEPGPEDVFSALSYVDRTSLRGSLAFLDHVIQSKKMLLANVNYSLLANSFVLGGKEVLSW